MHADNIINDKDIEPKHDIHKPMHEIVKSSEEMVRLQNEMSINEMPPMFIPQEAPKLNYPNVDNSSMSSTNSTNTMPQFGGMPQQIHTRQKL